LQSRENELSSKSWSHSRGVLSSLYGRLFTYETHRRTATCHGTS
jgi:hypothetical protein